MNYRLRVVALFLVICLFSVLGFAADIKVLLVTGQNNHNWKASSPLFKQMFDKSGIFDVEMLVTAPEGDLVDFKPDFSTYDVVVSDYNGGRWGDETEKAFEEYLKNGGGLVIIHAADNAFGHWAEYNKMIGLRWGGNEQLGPYIRWRDGKEVRDMTPGGAGGHGAQHAFQVINRDTEHPITKGLPEKWMQATDELYSSLRGPAENMTVLATAYADKAKGGTGENEPVLFTINYGKGRVFHTVLGHVGGENPPVAVQSSGFIVTLLRGTEWAATGKVGQDVPDDFSTADKVRLWSNYCEPGVADFLDKFTGYKYGGNRSSLDEIAVMINNAHGNKKLTSKLEAGMIKFLSGNSDRAAKQEVCRLLSLIATEKSVDVLAKLAVGKDTSHMARYVLERISSSKVDEALRSALAKSNGSVKAGIVNSLGLRGDSKSVSAISGLVYDSDEVVAMSAISALGRLGGKKAIATLAEAKGKLDGSKQKAVVDAYLSCAANLNDAGNKKAANRIYKELYKSSEPEIVRVAALRGLIASSKNGGKIILDSLKDKNAAIRAAAISQVVEVSNASQVKAIALKMSKFDDSSKLQLLTALSENGSKEALSYVIKETKSGNEAVRMAAYEAIGRIGDESAILLLANAAAGGNSNGNKAARESLYSLVGPKVDSTILAYIPKEKGNVKVELIKSVSGRLIADSMDTLLKCAQDGDSAVVNASLKTMSSVAVPGDVAAMVKLISKLNNAGQRKHIERAMVSGLRKNADPADMDKKLLVLLKSSKNSIARCSIVTVLGSLGCDSSLDALRKSLKSSVEEEKEAAFRALIKWPNAKPMMDMLQIAKTDSKNVRKILAIRSYIMLVGRPSNRSANENASLLEKAVAVASRNEEKVMILDALVDYPCPEAIALAESFRGGDLSDKADSVLAKLNMVSVTGRPSVAGGVVPKENADGVFKVLKDDDGDGTMCWVFRNYLYGDIDDYFCKNNGSSVIIEVLYKDNGGRPMRLQYDSTDSGADVGGAYKTASNPKVVNNGGKWRTASWEINDAKLSNRQNAGSDMRIATDGREFWVAKIKVSRK